MNTNHSFPLIHSFLPSRSTVDHSRTNDFMFLLWVGFSDQTSGKGGREKLQKCRRERKVRKEKESSPKTKHRQRNLAHAAAAAAATSSFPFPCRVLNCGECLVCDPQRRLQTSLTSCSCSLSRFRLCFWFSSSRPSRSTQTKSATARARRCPSFSFVKLPMMKTIGRQRSPIRAPTRSAGTEASWRQSDPRTSMTAWPTR